MNQSFLLGCVDDPEDKNDLMLSRYITTKYLPKSVSWVDFTIPVSNQGNQPACVGYSGANLKKAQEKLEVNKTLNIDGLALYKELKKIDGIPTQDGTYIRVLMKYLQKTGVKDNEGNNYKIDVYSKITDIASLKTAVVANGFVVIGIRVYDDFYKPNNGVIDYTVGQKSGGLHAVLAEAYDDNSERIIIKNSWGAGWGLGGYGYLSYKYLEKALHLGWTSVDLKNTSKLTGALFDLNKMQSDLIKIKNGN